MIYVVDASVLIKWYVPEIYDREADKILNGGNDLHAPELILPELSNIVWKKIRRGEIAEQKGKSIVAAFAKADIKFHPHKNLINSAFHGAAATGQTVYDWSYLALAVALSCQFVTADERFYKALENTKLKRHLLWIGDV